MKDCIFCKIAKGEIETEFIYESENIVAFNDNNPQAPTHILIIPKKHIKNISKLENNDKDLAGELLLTAKKIAEKLNLKDDGYRLVINTGDNGGQTVMHIHVHLLAGRKLNWPPG